MRLPLIIQFRRNVNQRRQSILFERHPGLILLIAFAGPLLAILGFSTYRGMQQYTAKGMPVIPLLLSGLAAWIGIGLSRQLRLNRDRKWNNFILTMPIRPFHLLALRIYIGIPIGLIGTILLICSLCGAGIELWTMSASVKWLLIVIAFVWAISIPLFLGIIASRFSWGKRFLLLALALWGIMFLGRFAWNLKGGNPYTFCLTGICLTDPVLVFSGTISLMCTLIPQRIVFPVTGFRAALHLVIVSMTLIIFSWRFVRHPPVNIPAQPKDLFMTIPLRKFFCRILPDSCGGQVSIELLRMMRGPRTRLLFYAIVSAIAGLGFQIAYPDSNHYILILVVFALFAVNERADLLQMRQADSLYYLHGVETRDYQRGLIVSVGFLISMLCFLQVLILRDWDTQIVCVCIAIAFSSMGMNVAFDHYSRHTKFFRYLVAILLFGAVISKAWNMIPLVILLSFNVIRIPCLIYSLILLSLSFGVNGLVPLLIAGMVVASEIYRTHPDAVKKWYWKVSI